MPPALSISIGFILLLYTVCKAYHDLENKKEDIEKQLNEIHNPKLSISFGLPIRARGPKTFSQPTIAWMFLNFVITNGSRTYPVSIKSIWLKRDKDDQSVAAKMYPQNVEVPGYKNWITKPFIEDHPYLDRNQTISRSIVFLEFVDQQYDFTCLSAEKYNAMIYILDSEGQEYTYPISNNE